jgi:hypothetical protein
MGYRLNMSTTRYEDARKYEFVGIPPQIYIEDKEDWINRAEPLKYWREIDQLFNQRKDFLIIRHPASK